jgi:hypothetical protein
MHVFCLDYIVFLRFDTDQQKNAKSPQTGHHGVIMKKILLAALSITATSSALAVNCNLPNISGPWGANVNVQNGAIVVNEQCQFTVGSVPGNATTAPVTGACLDLVTGFWGAIQAGSWVGFVGKSCQIQGQIITQVSSSYPQLVPVIFPGTLVTNISGVVSTNKQQMTGSVLSSGPMPNWWNNGIYGLAFQDNPQAYQNPLSGTFTASSGITLQPIQNVLSNGGYYAGLTFPYAPTTPTTTSSNGPGQGGNGNAGGNSNAGGNGNGNGKK